MNGRFRVHRITGMQRYAYELHQRLAEHITVIEPKGQLKGIAGHAWEQTVLPWSAGNRLLWSPCATGPVFRARQVVTIHDIFPVDFPAWFSGNFAKAYQLILPRIANSARRIISVSEYTKRRIVEAFGVPEEKVTVVYSGTSGQFGLQTPQALEDAAAVLKLPSRKYMLSVSSLEPRKNVRGILAAWEQALPYLPEDLWLVLAGGAGSQRVFAGLNLQKIPDRVFFPGYVEDQHLAALYAGATSFIFPSLAEGFGLPVLEAMSCGAPVLTSNNSSLLEIAGNAAVLSDPEKPSDIARSIVLMAQDENLRRSLRDSGLKRAATFTWDRSAAQTWQVLEQELRALGLGVR